MRTVFAVAFVAWIVAAPAQAAPIVFSNEAHAEVIATIDQTLSPVLLVSITGVIDTITWWGIGSTPLDAFRVDLFTVSWLGPDCPNCIYGMVRGDSVASVTGSVDWSMSDLEGFNGVRQTEHTLSLAEPLDLAGHYAIGISNLNSGWGVAVTFAPGGGLFDLEGQPTLGREVPVAPLLRMSSVNGNGSSLEAVPVPEPASAFIVMAGLALMAACGLRGR